MSENLSFRKGLETNLPVGAAIKAGTIYYCTDTGNTYIGTVDTIPTDEGDTHEYKLELYSTKIGMIKAINQGEIFNNYKNNIASGLYSHAEGDNTLASGSASHAGGYHTIASGDNQTVIGKFNKANTTSAFIIGAGTNDNDNERANIFTVDWDGNVSANTFIGQLDGTASRVKNNLSINGKTYNGSSAISVGIMGVNYGGTGYNSIADTVYTTERYRASSLLPNETTPTINGVIHWVYA